MRPSTGHRLHGGARFRHRSPGIPNGLSAKLPWKRAEEARVLDRSAAPILNKTEAAYQRGDLLAKRRRMMEAWAAFCATPNSERAGALRPMATA